MLTSVREAPIVVEGCTVTSDRFNMTIQERRRAVDKIMNYPLPHVEYRLKEEERIDEEQVPEAMNEWRKFMTTILYAEGSVGMISPIVDEVWHAHILFTREYATFCKDVFGQFIGHAPNWPGSPLQKGGGRRFIETYENLFGDLPAIWAQHHNKHSHVAGESHCDDCGPGKCGVSCFDCNGDPADCDTQ